MTDNTDPEQAAAPSMAHSTHSMGMGKRMVVAKLPDSSINPEQGCLDAIDALVEASIARGPTDDYDQLFAERCKDCCQRCGRHLIPLYVWCSTCCPNERRGDD